MRNLKFRDSSSREVSEIKHQTRIPVCRDRAGRVWISNLGLGPVLGYWCLVLVLGCTAHAQYSIDWTTIDGGGGTSTGGVYFVSGTIGQPDAASMSGGSYSLRGGFWSGISVVLTPGAPLLRILLTTTNTVVVSWPNPSSTFVLQQNTALRLANGLEA